MTHTWLTTAEKEQFYISSLEPISHLPFGYYEYGYDNKGFYLRNVALRDDAIFEVTPEMDKLLFEMRRFWDSEKAYKALRVAHKRGILMYGPPGSGKTTTIRQAINEVINRKGYAVRTADQDEIVNLTTAIGEIRKREPNAPVLAIIEDIDKFEDYSTSELLDVLDGTVSISNTLFIATTNYLDKVADRIKNRPGRFDTVIEVAMPSNRTRIMFVARLLDLPETHPKVIEYANHQQINGKSLAHLKEFVIFREIYGTEPTTNLLDNAGDGEVEDVDDDSDDDSDDVQVPTNAEIAALLTQQAK